MTARPLTSFMTSVSAHVSNAEFALSRARLSRHRRPLIATGIFLAFAVYYGVGLYPGVGGEINAGDSAKFQVLANAQIMVHGPGYPLYLMLAAVIRALNLPISGWWQIAFALSAVPGALANAFAFLIVDRATGSIRLGLAAAALLGSAHLMAIQATEAEVYALNVVFVLAVIYLLLLFLEAKRLSFFLAACAVYAASFGNHLMMVMLLPLFVTLSVLYRRQILRPKPIAIIGAFILLGASQYLYLAYVAYNPETAYSEYMPLPPSASDLLRYVGGAYFEPLYGKGLESSETVRALAETFQKAHPWVSVPLVAAGLAVFLFRSRRSRDLAWYKVALIYAGALCFLPFVVWYGPWDIEAFHLPLLALALVAATASLGWVVRDHTPICRYLTLFLILIGMARLTETGAELTHRESTFARIVPQIKEVLAQLPQGAERPTLALGYFVRMAAMYHYFAGDLPREAEYRLSWQIPNDIARRPAIGGAAMPERALQFVRAVQASRPDFACRTEALIMPDRFKFPAYSFRCTVTAERREPKTNIAQIGQPLSFQPR